MKDKITYYNSTNFMNERGDYVVLNSKNHEGIQIMRINFKNPKVVPFRNIRELFDITFSFPQGLEIEPKKDEYITEFEREIIIKLLHLHSQLTSFQKTNTDG